MYDFVRDGARPPFTLSGKRLLGSVLLATLAACGSTVAGTSPNEGSSAAASFSTEESAAAANVAEQNAADGNAPMIVAANGTAWTSAPSRSSGTATSGGRTTTSGASGASTSAPISTAGRLFASGFESGVSVTSTSVYTNSDQYLRGGDIPSNDWSTSLFGTGSLHNAWILSVVGENTPLPASAYAENTIKTVTGRDGQPTRALSLNSKMRSPNTTVQQITMQYVNMPVEPVYYQRMWVKFDDQTLARASRVGSNDFYQIFWEMKAEPDYRMRLELRLGSNGQLFWHAQGDVLYNANPLWGADLKTRPVVIAPASSAQGWHRVEVWMNRPGGRFKAAIDGATLIDYSGPLMGASGNRTNHLKTMMVYSDVAPIAETFFDDVEFWSQPPSNAWQ
jgi:hypothetical protein